MAVASVDKRPLWFRIARRAGGEIDFALAATAGALTATPNTRCFRVFAQRRSGHHAVINWIRYQLPGRHWFLNDCRPGENPFRSAQLSGSFVHGVFGEHRVMRTDREQRRRFTHKGAMLYGFEEYDIRRTPDDMPLEREIEWLGQSRSRHDVLILRDPFNLLASKLRWARGQTNTPSKPAVDRLGEARDLWKTYAREYLGMTTFLSDVIRISYNEWFVSRAYRDRVAAELGVVNRDRGVNEVARWGPTVYGDSFDGLAYDGRAQQMKVLERWREFAADAVYLDLVADDELHELSQRIFGALPGVGALRRTTSARGP
jgi:hypothetical protein